MAATTSDVPSTSTAMAAPQCYGYMVTAHRPSAVLASLAASFTSPDDLNLIISKGSRLEVHRLDSEGLQGIVDTQIYDRISSIKVFRPTQSKTDLLFVLTERMFWFVLGWDAESRTLKTCAQGNTRETYGRPVDHGSFLALDPGNRAVFLHQYEGVLRVLLMQESTGALSAPFTVRLDEQQVIDMQCLHSADEPAVAVIYVNPTTEGRHLQVYHAQLRTLDATEAWRCDTLDAGASLLIPVTNALGGGVIVLGEHTLLYSDGKTQLSQPIEQSCFTCWAPVDADGSRMLLGDAIGGLHLLLVAHDGAGTVTNLAVHRIGATSAARTVTYLDSGVCFVGSASGNSQLVRLPAAPAQGQNGEATAMAMETLQEFINLGPITDALVVDLDNMGQGQLVACCGTGRSGSVRLIRNGIGITVQAAIDLQGIRGVWSIVSPSGENHLYLVITFVAQTHVLAINDNDELDEAEVPGFLTEGMTLFCGSMNKNQAVQVMRREVRLVDVASGALVDRWECAKAIAKVASTGSDQLLVATGQGILYLLQTSADGLKVVAETDLSVEVGCIDVSNHRLADGTRLAAVGTWSNKVVLLSLPSFEAICSEDLRASDPPRSLLFMEMSDGHVLLSGMGDGTLIHWRISDAHKLQHKKQVSLGLTPISLSPFTLKGNLYVFAGTDRPAIVHEARGKLTYSPLNESNVTHLSSFSSAAFPGALAMGKDDSLMIVNIDAIQKLHIRTVPMGDQPRRITHQPGSATFGVVTLDMAQECSYVKVLSQHTWDVVAAMQFDRSEYGNCICSMAHPENPEQEYFIVGSAYVEHDEPEPTKGRLLVLQLVVKADGARELSVVGQMVLNGSVYQVMPAPRHPSHLVVTVNSTVAVFGFHPEAEKDMLTTTCTKQGTVLSLYLDISNDNVFVGDLMRSANLFKYSPEAMKQEPSLTDLASHNEGRWLTALSAIDDQMCLCTDNDYNMFVLRYNEDAEDDYDRSSLTVPAQMNVADFVNRIRPGSLVMQLPDSVLANCRCFLMVSVLGAISMLVLLPKSLHDQLQLVQNAMNEQIQGVGGLSHMEFRSLQWNEARLRKSPASNILDGDLIEQILDLPRDSVEAMMRNSCLKEAQDPAELLKIVEELHRMH